MQVLKGLKQPVTVTVFMTEGSPLYAETQELLKRYKAASPLLTVETLNPERNPARAQAFLKEMGDIRLSVVFRAGEKKKVVSVDQLAEFDFQRAQMGGEPAIKAFKGEQEFTAAILTVTQAKSPKVVFTKGHGERPIAGRLREGFERRRRAPEAGQLHRRGVGQPRGPEGPGGDRPRRSSPGRGPGSRSPRPTP